MRCRHRTDHDHFILRHEPERPKRAAPATRRGEKGGSENPPLESVYRAARQAKLVLKNSTVRPQASLAAASL
jgi:hypothetical protein